MSHAITEANIIHCPGHHKHRGRERAATRGAASLLKYCRPPNSLMPLPISPGETRRDTKPSQQHHHTMSQFQALHMHGVQPLQPDMLGLHTTTPPAQRGRRP